MKGFITNLGKYNEGHLVGQWIEFPISEEDLKKVLKEIGIGPRYEEFFFTDWEDDELDIDFLGEFESIDTLNEIGEALANLEASGEIDKLTAYMEAYGGDVLDALENLDNCTFYPGYSMEDVAEEIVSECYDLPEFALRYFDYSAFARDLRFDGYTETDTGVICQ